MHAKITWVVVADGQHAAVYHNDGPSRGLQAIPELGARREGTRTHDMMSDNVGRTAAGTHAHGATSMTPRTDPHELAEQRFTEGLAAQLNHAAAEKRFDHLILVAPPRTLGHLRHALSEPATKLVTAELHKDLTKGTTADLAKHLEEFLAV